ncbi:MAG: TolC family protein [Caulobacteraceae bacterium]
MVQLSVPEYPGRTFDAVLTRTSNAVDRASGTLNAELQIDNKDHVLKSGEYATAPLRRHGRRPVGHHSVQRPDVPRRRADGGRGRPGQPREAAQGRHRPRPGNRGRDRLGPGDVGPGGGQPHRHPRRRPAGPHRRACGGRRDGSPPMADRRRWALAAASAGLLLSACSFAPDYAPAQAFDGPAGGLQGNGPLDARRPGRHPRRAAHGGRCSADATLDDLEGRIEKANPDLAAALARYDQARALVSQARAAFLPEADYDGHFTRNRQSDQKKVPGSPTYVTDNLVGGEVTYEFDLWGRVRNTVKAQRGLSQASAADLAATRLSLQAQLASAYLSLRAMDAGRRRAGRRHRPPYQRALDLTQARYRDGASTEIDVDRARSQLEATRFPAGLDAVVAGPVRARHRQPRRPAGFDLLPARRRPAFPAPPAVPVTAASDLVQRRRRTSSSAGPTWPAAERRAFAANARIGVAKAAFFPTIGLDAAGGFDPAMATC